jgi:hypothetical protein
VANDVLLESNPPAQKIGGIPIARSLQVIYHKNSQTKEQPSMLGSDVRISKAVRFE